MVKFLGNGMEKVLGHNCFSGFSFSVASKIIKKNFCSQYFYIPQLVKNELGKLPFHIELLTDGR